MTKKIVFGALIVALVAFVAVPSASAACIPDKTAQTFGTTSTAYWHQVTATGTLDFQAWQLGAPGTFSSTGCLNDNITGPLFEDVGGALSYSFHLGSCGAGCPAPLGANSLVTLAINKTATDTEFLVDTVPETPAAANNYDYGAEGDHNMIKIPRPRVLSSSRAGTDLNLSVQVDSIAAGLFGPGSSTAVTGFNILSASAAADPGRDAVLYSLRATAASAGGAQATTPVTLDCTNVLDQWVVTQIQFENGAVLSKAVSAPTRVHCDQALANPKYKLVPKKLGAPKGTVN
jgi:hypothetical protein